MKRFKEPKYIENCKKYYKNNKKLNENYLVN